VVSSAELKQFSLSRILRIAEGANLAPPCGRLRILFIGTNLPIPTNNGSALRSLSIIKSLSSSGHEIHFLSFAGKDLPKTLDPLSLYCTEVDLLERDAESMSRRGGYVRRARCLLSRKPYAVERFRSRVMEARIEGLLGARQFDLVICDGLHALVNIPNTNVPIALNCHNVEYLIFRRYVSVEKNPFKKSYAALEAHLLRGVERRGCQRAAMAMACSDEDRRALRQLHPVLPVVIVPNAVDVDSYLFRESQELKDADPILLFQGAMDWYPNRDAVEFFVLNILGLVRAEFPTARFVVAGRNPPRRFVEDICAYPGVEFTGTVPDMRPYLSTATVVVVPLRMGSGTRIKILEAFAAGKPVVSTRLGAEGLIAEEGKDLLLADNPAEFARSVATFLRDPALRSAISKSGRALIANRYSQQVLKRSLDAFVSSLQTSVASIAPRNHRL